jgi:6-phosphofructokinase
MGVDAVNYLLRGETGVMIARQGRDQVGVSLYDVTTKMREIGAEYMKMAYTLSR